MWGSEGGAERGVEGGTGGTGERVEEVCGGLKVELSGEWRVEWMAREGGWRMCMVV